MSVQARSTSQLESHLVARHGLINSRRLARPIPNTACPECGKRFRFRAQLNKHRRRHVATTTAGATVDAGDCTTRIYRCRLCRNAYRHPQSLDLHAHVHEGGVNGLGRLTCDLCKKSYANKVLFQKHIIYMHDRTGSGDGGDCSLM